MNPGHFDQHLAPFYAAEVAAGSLSREQAKELLARALDERGFDRLVDAIGYAHRGQEPQPAHSGPVENAKGEGVDLDEPIDAGVEG